MIPWRPMHAIVARDLKRMIRQRGRLVSSMARPLIWLLVIGGGFGSLLEQLGREGYQYFLIAGILCMTLLFGAILASLAMVYDKEAGVMRMLMIAPFAHPWILVARTLSAAFVGLAHALLLLALLAAMGFLQPLPHLPLLAAGMAITALFSASLGTLIAVFSKTLENFAVIMNFFIFPVFFLSGALYPIEHLPDALKIATLLNPFSYCVDLLKHALLPRADLPPDFAADFSVARDLLLLVSCMAATLAISCLRFSRPQVLERLAARLSDGRRG